MKQILRYLFRLIIIIQFIFAFIITIFLTEEFLEDNYVPETTTVSNSFDILGLFIFGMWILVVPLMVYEAFSLDLKERPDFDNSQVRKAQFVFILLFSFIIIMFSVDPNLAYLWGIPVYINYWSGSSTVPNLSGSKEVIKQTHSLYGSSEFRVSKGHSTLLNSLTPVFGTFLLGSSFLNLFSDYVEEYFEILDELDIEVTVVYYLTMVISYAIVILKSRKHLIEFRSIKSTTILSFILFIVWYFFIIFGSILIDLQEGEYLLATMSISAWSFGYLVKDLVL